MERTGSGVHRPDVRARVIAAPQATPEDESPAVGSALRTRWRKRLVLWTVRLLFAAFLAGVWELIVLREVISEFWISRPSSLAARLADLLVSGQFYRDLYVTATEVAVGLFLGVVLGVLSGLVVAMLPKLYALLDPFIMVLYAMPRLALAPLFILWLGIGLASKVLLAMFVSYFLLLLSTHSGMQSVDRDLVNSVKMMGGGNFYILRKVKLPATLPWIFSGVRTAMGPVLAGAIVAEMLGAREGLGLRLVLASGVFDTTGVFAYLLVLAVMAMVLNAISKLPERKILHWRGTS